MDCTCHGDVMWSQLHMPTLCTPKGIYPYISIHICALCCRGRALLHRAHSYVHKTRQRHCCCCCCCHGHVLALLRAVVVPTPSLSASHVVPQARSAELRSQMFQSTRQQAVNSMRWVALRQGRKAGRRAGRRGWPPSSWWLSTLLLCIHSMLPNCMHLVSRVQLSCDREEHQHVCLQLQQTLHAMQACSNSPHRHTCLSLPHVVPYTVPHTAPDIDPDIQMHWM